MVARDQGIVAGRSDSRRPPNGGNRPAVKLAVHPTVWGVLVIGGVIAFLAIVHSGEIREGQFLGLLVFLVVGSIFPPLAIGIGIIIIVAMLYRGAGVAVGDWLSGAAGRSSGFSQAGKEITPPIPSIKIPTDYNPFPTPITNVTINNPNPTSGQA